MCIAWRNGLTDVDRIALRRDGELYFLDGRTIGDRAVFPRNC
jgi:hypothetical protein